MALSFGFQRQTANHRWTLPDWPLQNLSVHVRKQIDIEEGLSRGDFSVIGGTILFGEEEPEGDGYVSAAPGRYAVSPFAILASAASGHIDERFVRIALAVNPSMRDMPIKTAIILLRGDWPYATPLGVEVEDQQDGYYIGMVLDFVSPSGARQRSARFRYDDKATLEDAYFEIAFVMGRRFAWPEEECASWLEDLVKGHWLQQKHRAQSIIELYIQRHDVLKNVRVHRLYRLMARFVDDNLANIKARIWRPDGGLVRAHMAVAGV